MTVPEVKRHPEQADDEVFLGNTTSIQPLLSSLKTLRLGVVAYDINGKELLDEPRRLFPMFLRASEAPAYDRIRMQELSDIRAGRKRR